MKSLFRISARFGLLAGLIGIGLMIGLFYMGRHPFLIPVFMDFRIILFGFFIFFTLREIRDYHFGGILYFWQGIIASFMFTVCFASVSALALQAFMYFEPGFLEEYIRLSVEQLKSFPPEVIERIGREAYEDNLSRLPATLSSDLSFLYFTQSLLISLFLSIILSVILRRQPKNEP